MKPRPTIPTPILFRVSSFAFKVSFATRVPQPWSNREGFEKLSRGADVGNPLGTRLALEAEVAGEFHFAQNGKELGPVHIARSNHDCLSQGAGRLGPVRVF